MKLKATKVLAKLLNEKIKDYEISLVKFSKNAFEWYVDMDSYKHTIDFDWKTDKFSVICVSYPCEYYANDKYITTKNLCEIFKNSNKTLDGFIEKFFEYVEV